MFFRTFSSLWLRTGKKTKQNTLAKCCLVLLHVFYNCVHDSGGIDITFNVFPSGLAFEKNPQEEWPRWPFQKNLRTGSAGQWGLFFFLSLQLLLIWFCQAPVVVSPVGGGGSCIGLWHMQAVLVRRARTHECEASVIHGAVFTALRGACRRLFLLNDQPVELLSLNPHTFFIFFLFLHF